MIISIERLGQKGEGIAAGPLYVPYALPGDEVRVAQSGDKTRLVEIIKASAERIAPVCKHYTHCGGCAVQAYAPSAYQAWKRGLVVDALKFHKIETDIRPLHNVHGAGRRRVTFHARAEQGKASVGFMQARSHDLISIEACPLLDPALNGALVAARALAQAVAHRGKPMDIVITATETGLDIDLRGLGPLGFADVQKLTKLTQELDLARLSNHGAIILERRPPILSMGAAQVIVPPGAFCKQHWPPKRLWPRMCWRRWPGQSAWQTCFQALAHSLCGWRTHRWFWRWKATNRRWPRLKTARVIPPYRLWIYSSATCLRGRCNRRS